MDAIQQWGISLILALQTGLPGLAGVMKAFSFLGSEEFFLLAMPVLYWCVDAPLGARIALLLITSDAVNGLFKLAFHLPRPYWVDARVRAFAAESSYGLPSGHAQTAVAVWGGLAAQFKKRWAWITALIVIALISFSRMYLGVHFPSDVLTGWLIGAALVWMFVKWESALVARLRALNLWLLLGAALIVSVVYLVLAGGILLANMAAPDPPQWGLNAAQATNTPPGESAINPRDPESPVSVAGRLFGLGASLALMAHTTHARFNAGGPLVKRGLRFIVGVLGVLVFWLGLKVIFPEGTSALALTLRFVRYALIVLWALYFAPWVFVRLRLAEAR